MKTKKLIVIALGLAVMIGIAGCTPQDTGFNNNTDRLSTQTRINQNNAWDDNGMNGMTDNTLNGTGTNDLGMNSPGLNGNGMNGNGMNNDNLNNGMTRNNRLTTSLGNLNTNASNLARKIGNLPEVNKASVVLTNDTCLVGVDLKGNNGTNGDNVGTALRQKIESMVKDSTNNGITEVSITSDPDMFSRIRTMSNNMNNNNGNGIGNEITNDIEELIRDITPNGMNRTNRTNMNNR